MKLTRVIFYLTVFFVAMYNFHHAEHPMRGLSNLLGAGLAFYFLWIDVVDDLIQPLIDFIVGPE